MIEPYDTMRDDFLTIDSESDAKLCIDSYGTALSLKFLPKKYLYLLGKAGFNKVLSDNVTLKKKVAEIQKVADDRGEMLELYDVVLESLRETRKENKV
jgi:hypothetical protein